MTVLSKLSRQSFADREHFCPKKPRRINGLTVLSKLSLTRAKIQVYTSFFMYFSLSRVSDSLDSLRKIIYRQRFRATPLGCEIYRKIGEKLNKINGLQNCPNHFDVLDRSTAKLAEMQRQ